MKEITRIHIAKVSYDIELEAKKELEKYSSKLELYADEELLQDIEIRMTELLEERGVHAAGIITADDVAAIREQLGEPKEFLGDGDIAIGSDVEAAIDTPRRLYRDIENAVVGGVLSGVAGYLRTSVIGVRLGFIILLIMSFGTAALLYVVLWLVVPPARTAAEKLQLAGKPVTLASIRELNTSEELLGENKTAQAVQRVLLNVLGTMSAVAATVSLLVTIWVGAGLAWGASANSPLNAYVPGGSFVSWSAYALFVLSGLLLTVLFSLVAYVFFSRKWTKKIGICIVTTVIAGVLVFGSGIGLILYSNWNQTTRALQSTSTSRVDLSQDFAAIKKLTISTNAHVEYIVDDRVRYELTSATSVKPVVTVKPDSQEATISLQVNYDDTRNLSVQPSLTVYGPALDTIAMTGDGSAYYYNKNRQETLTATAQYGSLKINGTYGRSVAKTSDSGQILLNDATVNQLEATTEGGYITAGVVRELILVQPEVCPATADELQNRVEVSAVTSGSLMYNGHPKQAVTYKTECGRVVVGAELDL